MNNGSRCSSVHTQFWPLFTLLGSSFGLIDFLCIIFHFLIVVSLLLQFLSTLLCLFLRVDNSKTAKPVLHFFFGTVYLVEHMRKSFQLASFTKFIVVILGLLFILCFSLVVFLFHSLPFFGILWLIARNVKKDPTRITLAQSPVYGLTSPF